MLEFFTAQINNPHTRRAYLNAARRFAAWCEEHQIRQLDEVQPGLPSLLGRFERREGA